MAVNEWDDLGLDRAGRPGCFPVGRMVCGGAAVNADVLGPLNRYLQLLLLFLTLPLAVGQGGGALLFHHRSSLCFQGVKLGLSGQSCDPAVGAQLELPEPAQVMGSLAEAWRRGRARLRWNGPAPARALGPSGAAQQQAEAFILTNRTKIKKLAFEKHNLTVWLIIIIIKRTF